MNEHELIVFLFISDKLVGEKAAYPPRGMSMQQELSVIITESLPSVVSDKCAKPKHSSNRNWLTAPETD